MVTVPLPVTLNTPAHVILATLAKIVNLDLVMQLLVKMGELRSSLGSCAPAVVQLDIVDQLVK
jgi:hypothetical protein